VEEIDVKGQIYCSSPRSLEPKRLTYVKWLSKPITIYPWSRPPSLARLRRADASNASIVLLSIGSRYYTVILVKGIWSNRLKYMYCVSLLSLYGITMIAQLWGENFSLKSNGLKFVSCIRSPFFWQSAGLRQNYAQWNSCFGFSLCNRWYCGKDESIICLWNVWMDEGTECILRTSILPNASSNTRWWSPKWFYACL